MFCFFGCDLLFIYKPLNSIAPPSVRIVEAASSSSKWKSVQDALNVLPGPQFEETQVIPDGIKQRLFKKHNIFVDDCFYLTRLFFICSF